MRIIITLLTTVLLSSCGYQFQGAGSILPSDITKVYVPRVKNETTESRLTNLLTESLRDRFERYGVLVVVDEAKDADAILNAKILDVSREAKSVTSGTDTALQYNAVAKIAAELVRTGGGVLWRDPQLKVQRAYGLTSDVVVTTSSDFAGGSLSSADLGSLNDLEVSRSQEFETFVELADETARRVYESAVLPDF